MWTETSEHSRSCWFLTAQRFCCIAHKSQSFQASSCHTVSDEDPRGGSLGNDEAMSHFQQAAMSHQKVASLNWKWGVSHIGNGKQRLTFTRMEMFERNHRGQDELTNTATKIKKEVAHIHKLKGEKEVLTGSVTCLLHVSLGKKMS